MTTITGKSLCILALVIAVITACLLHVGNTSLQITEYEITHENLPKDFDNFKIALVSDLHGNMFGKGQAKLAFAIREFEADMIAIAGDLIDERDFTLPPALALIERIQGLAPICYVSGNHEIWSGQLDSFQAHLEKCTVAVLRNQVLEYKRGQSKIKIAGLDDPLAFSSMRSEQTGHIKQILSQITGTKTDRAFTVLIAHRPEFIDTYSLYNIDLVLSGHAHGGLIRLPGLGGLIAPGQGLRPRYTSGIYTKEGTKMVVSRGLGNSGFLQVRIFNRPELVLITLRSK